MINTERIVRRLSRRNPDLTIEYAESDLESIVGSFTVQRVGYPPRIRQDVRHEWVVACETPDDYREMENALMMRIEDLIDRHLPR